MGMNWSGLFNLIFLYFLLAPRCCLFVRCESSFLNDIETIQRKIPGFAYIIPKNSIEMSECDLEKVTEKDDRVTIPRKSTSQPNNIVVPSKPKISVESLEGFDVAKVEDIGNQIDYKLDEIKGKIKDLNDLALELKEDADSTPILGFPTAFSQDKMAAEGDSSQQPLEPKIQSWIDGLDLFDEEHDSKTTPITTGAPVRGATLVGLPHKAQTTTPNWSGSAKHLVKGGLIKEELLNQLDEEGRSVVAEFEKVNDVEPEEPNEYFSNEKVDSTAADPEELSNQENKLSSKLILTNEIPSGELMAENDFVYEGEKFSNSKLKNAALLYTPEQLEYNSTDDLKDDEPKELRGESKKKKKTKKKKPRKHKTKKAKSQATPQKNDFSPPVLDFSPKELASPSDINLQKGVKSIESISKTPQNPNGKKESTSKGHLRKGNKCGYDELLFELSENNELSSIPPPEEIVLPKALSTNENKAITGKGFNMKKIPLRKKEPEGYSELLDIADENSALNEEAIPVIGDTPLLQIAQKQMPKRSRKKPVSNIVQNNYSDTHKSKGLDAPTLLSPTDTLQVNNKDVPAAGATSEISTEIFDSSDTSIIGNSVSAQKLGALMHANPSEVKLNIPASNLPKRKNR
ncbi:putative integral membrane protein [Cryptosporidium canis]|nr:putative integral membrane protein [Cryptosporidium canis]